MTVNMLVYSHLESIENYTYQMRFQILLALSILSLALSQPNRFEGPGNVAYSGQGNTARGRDNTFRGCNNGVTGNRNSIEGDSNEVEGDENDIQGSENNVRGERNFVSGGNNLVIGTGNVINEMSAEEALEFQKELTKDILRKMRERMGI